MDLHKVVPLAEILLATLSPASQGVPIPTNAQILGQTKRFIGETTSNFFSIAETHIRP